MKVNIWIKKEEVLTGNITEYYTQIQNLGYEGYVQVSITPDEFAQLEDKVDTLVVDDNTDNLENVEDERSQADWEGDRWLVNQYNRNRESKDQVESRDEIPYVYERNSDTKEVFRRKHGDYDSDRERVSIGVSERDYSSGKELEELHDEMQEKTGAEFMTWFHKLTKNEQSKLAAYYND